MEYTPTTIREGLCFMLCSPLNAHLIGTIVPSVLNAMQRAFPRVRTEVLLDAVGAAVERCITSPFVHSDRSSGALFLWLRTAARFEVLRELRTERRYDDHTAYAEAIDALAGDHRADSAAARVVLRNWLVRRFGAAVAETLWLHSIEGCPPRDIAAMLSISIESVKARITRARKALRVLSGAIG